MILIGLQSPLAATLYDEATGQMYLLERIAAGPPEYIFVGLEVLRGNGLPCEVTVSFESLPIVRTADVACDITKVEGILHITFWTTAAEPGLIGQSFRTMNVYETSLYSHVFELDISIAEPEPCPVCEVCVEPDPCPICQDLTEVTQAIGDLDATVTETCIPPDLSVIEAQVTTHLPVAPNGEAQESTLLEVRNLLLLLPQISNKLDNLRE